jgi:hypothetical protein
MEIIYKFCDDAADVSSICETFTSLERAMNSQDFRYSQGYRCNS